MIDLTLKILQNAGVSTVLQARILTFCSEPRTTAEICKHLNCDARTVRKLQRTIPALLASRKVNRTELPGDTRYRMEYESAGWIRDILNP